MSELENIKTEEKICVCSRCILNYAKPFLLSVPSMTNCFSLTRYVNGIFFMYPSESCPSAIEWVFKGVLGCGDDKTKNKRELFSKKFFISIFRRTPIYDSKEARKIVIRALFKSAKKIGHSITINGIYATLF